MKKYKISSTIIVTFFTAYSYFISYQYQNGYYKYFNLPSFLIEISLKNIMTSFFSLFSFIFITYIVINGLTASIFNDTNVYIVKLIKKYIYISLIYFLLYTFGYKEETKEAVIGIVIGIVTLNIIVDFIKPIFTQKHVRGYKNKIINENKKIEKSDDAYEYKNSINHFLFKRMPLLPNLLLFLFITIIISYGLGNYEARNQKIFTIINNDKIILGNYNDCFIVKNIDYKEDALEPHFYLITNKENYKYTNKKIDYLEIK